ncbi:hypothetical protein LEP1GSC050_0789 [Leptospira broomii serovar Hurstbridge str. 5399]|uniref:Uncharacterized protein n=1 Tax=Leptospira broomii serovar Hurstbridge str. 5399 TaxID=1049789 RepID=T0GKE7_9LEPT|nr:hypothetical protein LEP1GSC050_0789 [Leptospira broomii serovar Hurstbridge str. 5399]
MGAPTEFGIWSGEWNWLNAPHPSWAGAGAKRWKIPYHKTIPLARSFQTWILWELIQNSESTNRFD